MLKVGQKVRFDPYHDHHSYGVAQVKGEVDGKVIFINKAHHYFTAEYKAGGEKFKISFKFDDAYCSDVSKRVVHIVN